MIIFIYVTLLTLPVKNAREEYVRSQKICRLVFTVWCYAQRAITMAVVRPSVTLRYRGQIR